MKDFPYLDSTNYLDVDGNQAVGKFKRGLYKDCSTTMNSEIIDRVFEGTRAFMAYYFGFNNLLGYTLHGGYNVTTTWSSFDGWTYWDRENHFLTSEAVKNIFNKNESI